MLSHFWDFSDTKKTSVTDSDNWKKLIKYNITPQLFNTHLWCCHTKCVKWWCVQNRRTNVQYQAGSCAWVSQIRTDWHLLLLHYSAGNGTPVKNYYSSQGDIRRSSGSQENHNSITNKKRQLVSLQIAEAHGPSLI